MAKDRFGFGTTVLDKVREVSANQELIVPEIEEPLVPSRKWWDSYNNYTKYEDEPHYRDYVPTLQRNNPRLMTGWDWIKDNLTRKMGDPQLPEEVEPQGYQEGGEINIKPSKVGSFTAW